MSAWVESGTSWLKAWSGAISTAAANLGNHFEGERVAYPFESSAKNTSATWFAAASDYADYPNAEFSSAENESDSSEGRSGSSSGTIVSQFFRKKDKRLRLLFSEDDPLDDSDSENRRRETEEENGYETETTAAETESGAEKSGGAAAADAESSKRKTKGLGLRELYRLERKIGSGSTSIVFSARHRESGRRVAVKCIDTDKLDERRAECLMREVKIMRQLGSGLGGLGHPCIVQLLGVFDDDDGCMIVQELAEGGNMLRHLKSRRALCSENEARTVSWRLLDAAAYLAEQGVVHRDIKPENCLLAAKDKLSTVKLGDFGFAVRLSHISSFKKEAACGTAEYVAPEILLQETFDGRADVWSLGVTVFSLLSGAMPFDGQTNDQLFRAILAAKYNVEGRRWRNISQQAKHFVSKMLQGEQEQRWTARQLLSHPWLTGNDDGPPEQTNDTKVNTNRSASDANSGEVRIQAATAGAKGVIRAGEQVPAGGRGITAQRRPSCLKLGSRERSSERKQHHDPNHWRVRWKDAGAEVAVAQADCSCGGAGESDGSSQQLAGKQMACVGSSGTDTNTHIGCGRGEMAETGSHCESGERALHVEPQAGDLVLPGTGAARESRSRVQVAAGTREVRNVAEESAAAAAAAAAAARVAAAFSMTER